MLCCPTAPGLWSSQVASKGGVPHGTAWEWAQAAPVLTRGAARGLRLGAASQFLAELSAAAFGQA